MQYLRSHHHERHGNHCLATLPGLLGIGVSQKRSGPVISRCGLIASAAATCGWLSQFDGWSELPSLDFTWSPSYQYHDFNRELSTDYV